MDEDEPDSPRVFTKAFNPLAALGEAEEDGPPVVLQHFPSWIKGRLRYDELRVSIMAAFLKGRGVDLVVQRQQVSTVEHRVPLNDTNIGMFKMLIYENTAYEIPIRELPATPNPEEGHTLEMLILLVASFGPIF